MNYEETLSYLYEQLPMFQRVGKTAFKKDLSNTLKLCEALGNPESKFKSVHIAGTNGKGSTAHSIASVLMEAGYKTGLYTSPHLKSFTERIKINGQEASEQFIIDFVQEHKEMIEEIKPSFFEITVVMAFDYFARNEVDIAVIEVGMGGRFDSTNVIDPILSIITTIGLDHMEFLGSDLATIAFEKAGIIKNSRPVIISNTQEETTGVFVNKAREMNAPIAFADRAVNISREREGSYNIDSEFYNGKIEFDLKGDYQQWNLHGIIAGIEALANLGFTLKQNHIKSGLENVIANTGIKGRWQTISRSPLTICDTGHNEDGIKSIVSQIDQIEHDKLILVLGFVNDKALENLIALWPDNAYFIFTQANIPRAKKATEIKEMADRLDLKSEVSPNVNEALARAKEIASENDLIFIGGSTFVVAELEEI